MKGVTNMNTNTNFPIIRDKRILALAKAYHEAATAKSAAEKVMTANKPHLIDAMDGAPTALIGPYSLVLDDRAGTVAKITMADKREIPLASIASFTLRDGSVVSTEHVAKLVNEREATTAFSVKVSTVKAAA